MDFIKEGLTVADVLEMPEMKRIELLAGSQGITNKIRSVTVLEVPRDHDRWLQGNELCLTTLYNFIEQKVDLIELIENLSRNRVAALAVHPGFTDQNNITDRMVSRADSLKLPLLILPREMPYISIFMCIFRDLLNRKASVLDKSHHINKVLSAHALQGGDISRTITILQELLEKPVALFSPELEVLERSSPSSSDFDWSFFPETLKSRLQNHDISKNTDEDDTILQEKHKSREYLLIPVQGQQKLFAYLATCGSSKNPIQQLDHFALRHAMTVVGFNYLKESAIDRTRYEISSGLMEDLLNGNYDRIESICHRAKQLGLQLKYRKVVMVIDIDDFEKYYLKNFEKGEEEIQRIKSNLYAIVQEEMDRHFADTIILTHSDSLIVFPLYEERQQSAAGRQESRRQLTKAISSIKGRREEELPQISLSIGIGSYKEEIRGLKQSFEEANTALRFSSLINPSQSYAFYDQLGIYRLLSGYLANGSDKIKNYCQEHLKPLLAYDAEKSTDLLETLEKYLDYGESPVKTAEKLFVHPNTIKYRIDRIIEILGYDPTLDPEEKLALHLALKLYKIL